MIPLAHESQLHHVRALISTRWPSVRTRISTGPRPRCYAIVSPRARSSYELEPEVDQSTGHAINILLHDVFVDSKPTSHMFLLLYCIAIQYCRARFSEASESLDTTLCDPMHVRPDPSTPDCDASRLTLSRCPVSSTQHNTIFIQTWLCTGSSAVFRYVSYTVHGTTAHAHSISWCWDDLTYRYTHRTELPAACCLLHATC
jgi:hypothetical protein